MRQSIPTILWCTCLILPPLANGCVQHWSDHRVFGVHGPFQSAPIERFDINSDCVRVVAREGSFLCSKGHEESPSLDLTPGQSFQTRSFDGWETWRLLTIAEGHAIFDRKGGGTADVGVYPFLPSGEYDGIVVICPHVGANEASAALGQRR